MKGKVKKDNKKVTEKSERRAEDVPVINSFTRILISFAIAGVAIIYRLLPLWNNRIDQNLLAAWNDTIGTEGILREVPCDPLYRPSFVGCEPVRCGRYITDRLISTSEAERLVKMAYRAFRLSSGSGGATVLDLHSGAISYGSQFTDVRRLAKEKGIKELFTKEELSLYADVKDRIKKTVEKKWRLKEGRLKLTKPTFFSKMSSKPPATLHDEYWHVHTDTDQYDMFHYTSLLYLNTHNLDYKGGRFLFDSPKHNHTIEPKKGRVMIFTSGTENPHHVERVTWGTRYAITIPFTCHPDYVIDEPHL